MVLKHKSNSQLSKLGRIALGSSNKVIQFNQEVRLLVNSNRQTD